MAAPVATQASTPASVPDLERELDQQAERLLAGEERKFQPGDRQPTPPPGSQPEPGDETTES